MSNAEGKYISRTAVVRFAPTVPPRDGLVCVLHNAYNPEQLVKAFSAGETVKTNYGKDYDKEFDEAGFCRVLAAALDSGRDNMDFFDAAKLAKERSQ